MKAIYLNLEDVVTDTRTGRIIDKEHQMLIREEWLSDNGRSSKDVMVDDGGEYILVDNDMEEYEEFDKIYLPAHLQSSFTPF